MIFNESSRHSYEWYVIEDINDPDKRLGVTKDDIAAVDLAIRWNGREWLSEDRLKLDSFKHDPIVADACARLQQMLDAAPGVGEGKD